MEQEILDMVGEIKRGEKYETVERDAISCEHGTLEVDENEDSESICRLFSGIPVSMLICPCGHFKDGSFKKFIRKVANRSERHERSV